MEGDGFAGRVGMGRGGGPAGELFGCHSPFAIAFCLTAIASVVNLTRSPSLSPLSSSALLGSSYVLIRSSVCLGLSLLVVGG